MTLQSALQFIHHVMNKDDGRNAVGALGPDAGLEKVIRLGRDSGFEFSRDELRRAFRIDWQMRARYYSSLSEEQPD